MSVDLASGGLGSGTDQETQAAESEARGLGLWSPWREGHPEGRGSTHRPGSGLGRSRESTTADVSGVSPREQRECEASVGQGRLLQIDLGGSAAGGCRSPGPEGRGPRAQPALISTGRGLINPRRGLPGRVRIMETGRAPGGASGAVGGAGPGASPSRARAEAGRGVRGGAQPPRALSAAGPGRGEGAGVQAGSAGPRAGVARR